MATVEKITFRCYTDSGIYFYAKTDAPNNEWLWMDENSGGLVSSADELKYQGNYNMQLYKIISIDENSVYYNADFLGGGSNSTATRYSAGDLKTVEEVPEPDPQPQPGGGNLKMHTFFRREKRYWRVWKQPILTANGTMGGDSFAVSSNVNSSGSHELWKAFNGNSNNDDRWQSVSTNGTVTFDFYNPQPLKLYSLVLNYGNGESYYYPKEVIIQGSDDGNSWTDLTTLTNNAYAASFNIQVNSSYGYKYHRLKFVSFNGYNSDNMYVIIRELIITAKVYDEHWGYKAYSIMRRNKAYNIIDPFWETGSQTFNYTGALQTYTVPEGVTQIEVDCVGAKGYTASLEGGLGGRVKTKLTVTPGQELKVWVGQAHSQIATPEYNASDIRTSSADITSEEGLLSRLIVAGGGGDGSQTNWGGGKGGHGGGLIGGSGREGYGTEATGGTQTAGGTGGTHGAFYGGGSGQGYPGTFGLGGATKKHDASYSGCGGAGWYGGGGGSVCSVNKKYFVNGVAGAGGSSYTDPELCSEVSHAQGYQSGNGYVKISYKVRRRF